MWRTNLFARALILILVSKNLTLASTRRWSLEFYSLECKNNSNTIKKFECDFNKLATSHYNFSVRLMFNKKLDKQFFVRYYIDVKPYYKQTVLHFIDVKLNSCDAVRTNYEIPLLRTAIRELRRTSNIPYQCPFQKEFLYEITNLSVTDNYLKTMSLPTLNFTNGIEMYESNKLIASFLAKGGIVTKT